MMPDSPEPVAPAAVTRLADYTPPAWVVRHVDMAFDLDREATIVVASLRLERRSEEDAPLVLDGEELDLRWLELDGRRLPPTEYQYDGRHLRLSHAPAACVLRSEVRLRPDQNTRLEGLYASGRLLLTQCEAEGFRRITFFTDRPDVLATWETTLRAERARFPVLLAGGNPVSARDLGNGRHETTWRLPHPMPSYLFAIAAGPMAPVSRELEGADGRHVTLNVWREGDDASRCRYALGAVERALRWDEMAYGRCYDLDVFNVVAADDFTMGAMENKGLNIFNARFIVADESTATDADFLGIESVVGHEYFHNWTGNRVTLRDWFQLSLKEGLTVFRDQSFSADLHSRPLKRIDDVRVLRSRQFAEDAGGLAHPVRPEEYREINNFYTATVYEKGAEIIRMLRTRIGAEAFRRGMDRYFAAQDGKAAVLEDFYSAHAEASGQPVQDMLAWYAQAGTPTLRVQTAFDGATGRFSATIEQKAAPHVPGAKLLPLPLRFAAYDTQGRPLPMPGHDAKVLDDGLLWLTRGTHVLVWDGLDAEPLLVVNQDFAAPVQVQRQITPGELARIVAVEPDGFARWDALQALVTGLLRGELPAEAEEALSGAIGALLASADVDPALVAECLSFADVDTLTAGLADVDPGEIAVRRQDLITRLARAHQATLEDIFERFAVTASGGIDDVAMAARSLRHAALAWLCLADGHGERAHAALGTAQGMTAQLAALRALVHSGHHEAAKALAAFAERFRDDPLVTDKWLGVVATTPGPEALDAIEELLQGPWWKPTNPNRVRAVIGNLARGNPRALHRADGAGYRLLTAQLGQLDAINPQVAARLLTGFEAWRRWTPALRMHAESALRGLRAVARSNDLTETLHRLLD